MGKNKLALFVIGIIFLVGVYFVFSSITKRNTNSNLVNDEVTEVAADLPIDQRPLIKITPRSDGHWLKLSVSELGRVVGAASLDYRLEYEVPGKPTQGASGSNIKLSNVALVERDILLGSESSGKFRYDEGVERGMVTVRFRDANKKLIGKAVSEFRIFSKTDKLVSYDEKFKYSLKETLKKGYITVVTTSGMPEGVKEEILAGPYGVFSSDQATKYPGKIEVSGGEVKRYSEGKWMAVTQAQSPDIGIFVNINK